MKRYLETAVCADLPRKAVLLTGPRQCGKTTFARSIYPAENYDYLNYDNDKDQVILREQSWDRTKQLVIFDEIHKMTEWKRWLKGVYDTEKIPPEILVTGSAKLNTFKKVGDSMAGRYFQFQMHPLDLKELATANKTVDPTIMFEQLWHYSGFPEPYFENDLTFYKRWRKTHLEIILRQDLLDLYTVQDLRAIEDLVKLLRTRVGASISYTNLAQDLKKDINTIKRYLVILEELYIIYRVTPYSKKIARSLLKEPKFYFYDHNYASTEGAKLENLVANALFKELHFIRDTQGDEVSLHYLRNKDGKEIDFLLVINDNPTHMIEIKTKDDQPSKAFAHYAEQLPDTIQLQLVKTIKRTKTYPSGVQVKPLVKWLAELDL